VKPSSQLFGKDMSKARSHASISILLFAALIGIVAPLPSTLPCPEMILPGIKRRATNGENLASLKTNISMSFPSIITAGSHYHIPDTPIDLKFTSFHRPIASGLVFKTVEVAIEEISTNVNLHPTLSITGGVFQQVCDSLEINIYEYSGKQVTWSTLNQLLLGIQYFTQDFSNSREFDFEIDVSGNGRVGYGSLQYTNSHGLDLTERASLQLPNANISQSTERNSRTRLILPSFTDENIVFSFHFFGQNIPAAAVTTSYRRARQRISDNVRLHPNDDIANGSFKSQLDETRVEISVAAHMDKQLTWLLLDNVLERLAAKSPDQRFSREFVFDFETFPFLESYGHGSVRYLL